MPEIDSYIPLKAQRELHNLVRGNECAPFKNGVQQILLSGSVGSSKSEGMAHELIVYALENPKCHVGLGRKSMPQLRDTLLKSIIDHMGIKVEYEFNKTRGIIEFENGSRMTCLSWADGQFKKVRSYEFEVFSFEELTENNEKEIYTEILQRVGRREQYKKQFVICATNPDSPSHWAYKHFIDAKNENRHVIYSKTIDNIHLPSGYINTLRENLSPKEVLRQLEGQWIELSQDVIYYNYLKDRNYIDKEYTYNEVEPLVITFDFNIGEGKPMSCVVGQKLGKVFHFAKDFIRFGQNTPEMCAEIIDYYWNDIERFRELHIHGDFYGKSKDTRNTRSDYDIIMKAFENRYPAVSIVRKTPPSKNPAIRSRHNLVNAQFLNDLDEVKCYVYKDAQTLDEGFRLAALKKGASVIEDDSKYYQHVTTAAGYWIHRSISLDNRGKSRRIM